MKKKTERNDYNTTQGRIIEKKTVPRRNEHTDRIMNMQRSHGMIVLDFSCSRPTFASDLTGGILIRAYIDKRP